MNLDDQCQPVSLYVVIRPIDYFFIPIETSQDLGMVLKTATMRITVNSYIYVGNLSSRNFARSVTRKMKLLAFIFFIAKMHVKTLVQQSISEFMFSLFDVY